MTQAAQQEPEAENSGNPLDSLQFTVSDDMKKVNAQILKRMESDVALIPELAAYIIAAGGKRIRPLLTLACAGIFDYQGKRHTHLAACVEFIHTATLLHDDVVDESTQRRGRPSANAVFGNQSSVLVGDFLFSRAFELMVEDGDLTILKILSGASSTIAEGEVLQLMTDDLNTDFESYLKIVKAKTAVLFAAACEVGGVVADCTDAQQAALRAYGTNLGIAFQITDDLLDYSPENTKLGKNTGDDFREGKITFPIVLAMQNATEEERTFWQEKLIDGQREEGDFTQACDILKSHDVFEQAQSYLNDYTARAKEALQSLPQKPLTQDLAALVTFIIDRKF